MMTLRQKSGKGALATGTLSAIIFLFGVTGVVHADYVLQNPDNGFTGNAQAVGYDPSFALAGADSFTTIGAGTVSSIDVYARKVNSPTDNMVVSIYTDSGGVPGTSVAASNVFAVGAPGLQTATFASPVSLSAATTYWIVIARDGAYSATNFYQLSSGTTNPGTERSLDGGVWSIDGTDNQSYVFTVVEGSSPTPPTVATSTYNCVTKDASSTECAIQVVDNPAFDLAAGMVLFLVTAAWIARFFAYVLHD